MWTRLLFWICVFSLVCSCQREIEGIEENEVAEEKVPVSFSLSMQPDVLEDTEITPMTRASSNVYKTWLNNSCKILVLKKTGSKWIVERFIDGKINSAESNFFDIKVKENGNVGNIALELRPGRYKMSVFFNLSLFKAEWNENLKPGYVVSEAEDILPEEDLLPAFLYFKNPDSAYMHDNAIFLNREIFTGYTEFTVEKAGDLQTPVANPGTIQVERKVGYFRFLLKKTEVDDLPPFKNTQHTLNATFTLPEGKYFPVGLNILGDVYYNRESPCRTIRICCNDSYVFLTSPLDGKEYRFPMTNATVYAPYIILDKRQGELTATFKNGFIAGQSGGGGFTYDYEGSFNIGMKANTMFGMVFATLPGMTMRPDGSWQAKVTILEDVDANALFDVYSVWNL